MRNKLRTNRLIRYILAGVSSYAIELSVLMILHVLGHLSVEAATAIAFWVGILTSFFFQKLFAFKDYQKTLAIIAHQSVSYGLLVAFNYVFTLFVVAMFPSRLIILSRSLALIIITIWNYLLYKYIFRQRDTNSKKQITKKNILIFVLLSLPIVLFFYQYIATSNRLIPGDFDYYAQAYEAFRISVLHYHQFPWWNPWMSGGVPLFANPQFGLLSLQSLLVLPFGAIYGLKLAYVIYAIAGFWGMFVLSRRVIKASELRSILISYIWVFSGFFAGHSVSHVTTTSFFLMPWLIYLLVKRDNRYSWLWFGLLVSAIVLSAIDFVLLMILFVLAVLFVFFVLPMINNGLTFKYKWKLTRDDLWFVCKSVIVVIVLCGYRFAISYSYAASNPRPAALLNETRPALRVLFDALFLPISTLLKIPTHLQWGWGEYSMYMGMGVSIAFILCAFLLIVKVVQKIRNKDRHKLMSIYVWSVIVIGIIGFLLALGNFGPLSPYHLLKLLPGYSQTRVSSRWLFLTAFAILTFIAAWKSNKKLINLLLALAAIELFFTYGPPRIDGSQQVKLPPSHFSNVFSEYDNGRDYLDAKVNPMDTFYYSTSENAGQVYSDESFVDTLDKVIGTDKCGVNVDPNCTFVMTHNARVVYWSPNKIRLIRTAPGSIKLNMNVASGWKVNNKYVFASIKRIDPSIPFILPGNSTNYVLDYAPRFSPAWFNWRVSKL